MKELKLKLQSLCIFRELLRDPVISALLAYLEEPSNSSYAVFAAALFEANGGNITEYVREICAAITVFNLGNKAKLGTYGVLELVAVEV